MRDYKITGGLYLVLDPTIEQDLTSREDPFLENLEEIIIEGVELVQIWDNWPEDFDKEFYIHMVWHLCNFWGRPVFINNDWQLLKTTELEGVHFDSIPDNMDEIRRELDRPFLAGLTCGNDLSAVQWAKENKMDYISFCSMFPSSTANSCELVSFKTIQEARKITDIPIFLAGGIQADTMTRIQDLNYDGIAIASGIMAADNPSDAAMHYVEFLKNKKQS